MREALDARPTRRASKYARSAASRSRPALPPHRIGYRRFAARIAARIASPPASRLNRAPTGAGPRARKTKTFHPNSTVIHNHLHLDAIPQSPVSVLTSYLTSDVRPDERSAETGSNNKQPSTEPELLPNPPGTRKRIITVDPRQIHRTPIGHTTLRTRPSPHTTHHTRHAHHHCHVRAPARSRSDRPTAGAPRQRSPRLERQSPLASPAASPARVALRKPAARGAPLGAQSTLIAE